MLYITILVHGRRKNTKRNMYIYITVNLQFFKKYAKIIKNEV